MKDLQMRTNLSHNKQLSLGLYSVPTNELMAFQYKARKVDSKYFAESSLTFNQHFFLINIFDFMTCYLCILANLLLTENKSSSREKFNNVFGLFGQFRCTLRSLIQKVALIKG